MEPNPVLLNARHISLASAELLLQQNPAYTVLIIVKPGGIVRTNQTADWEEAFFFLHTPKQPLQWFRLEGAHGQMSSVSIWGKLPESWINISAIRLDGKTEVEYLKLVGSISRNPRNIITQWDRQQVSEAYQQPIETNIDIDGSWAQL